MNNWEWKKLGDVCDSINGLWKGKKEPFVKVGVIRNTNFTKDCKLDLDRLEYLDVEQRQYAKRKLQPGDLIIEKSGGSEKQPVGRAILFNERDGEYSFSNFTSVLRIKDQNFLNSNFLHIQLYKLYLDGVTKPMQSATTGIHNLDFDKFNDLDICVPPLAEQKRIVKTLDEKFAKIDKLKTAAETNLKNAREIFNAELENVFSNKNWDLRKLNDLCELISGYAFDSKGYSSNDEDTLLVCGDNIMHCSFRWETVKRWPKEKYNELKRFELKDSDIVLAMDRPWIKSGLKISKITEKELPSLLVQRTAALRVVNHILSDYLYYALQNKKFSDYLIDQQTGVGVPHISGKQILNFQIPLPPLSDQKRIVAHLDKLSEKVKRLEENYRRTIADCEELKKSILKQFFEVEA